MSVTDPQTPEEQRQHDELVKAAQLEEQRKRLREKRRRGGMAKGLDFDVFTGEST